MLGNISYVQGEASSNPSPPLTQCLTKSLTPPSSRASYDTPVSETSSPRTTVAPSTLSSSTLVDQWGNPQTPRISTTRLLFAHLGAALTLFLATTDATFVSTALPTISSQFHASQIEYTWVGVSYMLTQTAFQPLYGKLSDLVGRKLVLYSSMLIFVVGSTLCGAAQSILWLILARALAGIGGGGIVSLVWTITSEIVEVQSRAKWSQALSITWSCSAVAGPLIGGIFSGQEGALSWRWIFFLNIPICFVASVVLWISLRHVNFQGYERISWNDFTRSFDFVGLLLFMTGSTCIIVGFSLPSLYGWQSPLILLLIIGGLVILVIGCIYEFKTRRDALFPRSGLTDPASVIILIVNFLHNFVFNIGTFYLAIYFQSVQGFTPLHAGLTMLPYSLGSSIASMPTAWFIGYWQRLKADTSGQKLSICVGLALSALGFGLMILLDMNSGRTLQSIFPLIAGVGLGMLFHAPYQVFTRILKPKEIASGTSAFFLVRFTGATVGLASRCLLLRES
ncbi:MFS general substrate transporter [Panus rudis PR-1116 ss-1]|nr:MFS general substrate transporter [Panus rudis PR-1116 ss-1]